MALSYTDLVELGKTLAGADRAKPVSYSVDGKNTTMTYAALDTTFRKELNELVGTPALYRENKNLLFKLIEEVIEDVLPQKVIQQYSQFAEIKTFGQGDRPVFIQKITMAAKRRAKQFITKVGLAGIYEVFKLDGKKYEVPTSAIGGAAQIGWEEYLDGRVDFADVLNIVLEGLDEAIYLEIERALVAAVNNLQVANKHSGSGFNEAAMDRLLAVADSYGQSTIYCTFEFAATMVPTGSNWNVWVSESMKNEKWSKGYFATYKGHNVVILPQSYEDETNTTKVIDPSYAWIIPTGAEKPVKVAFEGQAIVQDINNRDLSREIQIYKKVGVAAIITNNICVYQNTDLTR